MKILNYCTQKLTLTVDKAEFVLRMYYNLIENVFNHCRNSTLESRGSRNNSAFLHLNIWGSIHKAHFPHELMDVYGLQQMGNPDIWALSQESGGASWPFPIWRDPCPAGRGKEAVPEAAKSQSWTDFICLLCGRDCHSQIGLLSHTRHCSKSAIKSMLP